jgi:CBS domain-containing protein
VIDTLVERLMTDPTITVSREETAAAVARRMLEADVKSVVVVDEERRPEGILTSTDYLEMTAEGVNPHETTVAAFLTTDVVTATPDEEVGTVAGRMLSKGISHLPVVDADGRLAGIITTTDLTEHLAYADAGRHTDF